MNDLIMDDAAEYGRHVKGGDWRLGLLVARSVVKGKPGPKGDNRADPDNSKVTISTFSEMSGVTAERISAHLKGWDKAAAAGIVTASADLNPGDDIALDRDSLGEFSVYYTPVGGGYNGGADRVPTVGNVKSGIDKLSPKERGQILADLVGDDQAFSEAPQAAKQELVRKAGEMVDNAAKTGKQKVNMSSGDVIGWNDVQFAISDAAAKVAKATSDAMQLQHGSDIANDKSILGVGSAFARLRRNANEFATLLDIPERVGVDG